MNFPQALLRAVSSIRNLSLFFLSNRLWSKNRHVPFLRLIKLQLVFSFFEKEIAVNWLNSLILPLRKGDTSLTLNYYLGLSEFDEMCFMMHILREGELFVDIGANLGAYSLIASGFCAARSLAFEPAPKTFQRLCHNVAVNLLSDKVTTKNVALTSIDNRDANGGTSWFSSDQGAMNSLVNCSYKGTKDFVSLSILDQEVNKNIPILLKIDVEGHEIDVLAGASEILASSGLLAIIIEGQSIEVNNLLRDYGFMDFNYNGITRELSPFFIRRENRIWIRKEFESEIKARLVAAPKTRLFNKVF